MSMNTIAVGSRICRDEKSSDKYGRIYTHVHVLTRVQVHGFGICSTQKSGETEHSSSYILVIFADENCVFVKVSIYATVSCR